MNTIKELITCPTITLVEIWLIILLGSFLPPLAVIILTLIFHVVVNPAKLGGWELSHKDNK